MNAVNLFIVSTTKRTWPSRYSTTNCGHSSNRCCPLPNYDEPVIRGASRSTIVRCSPAFSSLQTGGSPLSLERVSLLDRPPEDGASWWHGWRADPAATRNFVSPLRAGRHWPTRRLPTASRNKSGCAERKFARGKAQDARPAWSFRFLLALESSSRTQNKSERNAERRHAICTGSLILIDGARDFFAPIKGGEKGKKLHRPSRPPPPETAQTPPG